MTDMQNVDVNYCTNCGKEVWGKAKTCSDKCRKALSRSVTDSKCDTSSLSHLRPAIVAGIERLTTNPDGTIDEQARTNRMAIAKSYQRLYPEQPYKGVGIAPEDMPANPVPVRVSKPGDADYKPLCQFTRDWVAAHV